MEKGILIDSVSFGYRHKGRQLEYITLSIPTGSFFGITGINGSGKTTLAYLFNGLIPNQIEGYYKGNVYVDGENTRKHAVSYFARKVGMMFQNPDFMLFNLTVREEIEFGLKNFGFKNTKERITQALKNVRMEGFENRDPQTLSLGQKQKIALACILAQDSPYIVLDEPTAMLDFLSATRLYTILHELNQKGKTIIIIEHDTDFLLKYASTCAVIDKGQIILTGNTKFVFSQKKKLRELGIKIPQPHL